MRATAETYVAPVVAGLVALVTLVGLIGPAIKSGWLSAPFQVSTEFGDTSVWPGDTIGVSATGGGLVLSWGSATPTTGKKSGIFAAAVTVS